MNRKGMRRPLVGQVEAVNRGVPRTIPWRGREYFTAFVKHSVDGPSSLDEQGLVGDKQADMTSHGGPDKAVYAYAKGHYRFWERSLGRRLAPGAFGENLTISGLDEELLEIGDELRAGTALLRATQPRLPCVKMSVCFDRPDMPRRFIAACRPGVYLAVVEPGVVSAGDTVARETRSGSGWSVRQAFRILAGLEGGSAQCSELASVPWLGRGSRALLASRLSKS